MDLTTKQVVNTSNFNSMVISEDPSVMLFPMEPIKSLKTQNVNWDLKPLGIAKFRHKFNSEYKYSSKVKRSIPCLFIPSQFRNEGNKDKMLIHFHGNAEDLRGIFPFLCHTSDALEVSFHKIFSNFFHSLFYPRG